MGTALQSELFSGYESIVSHLKLHLGEFEHQVASAVFDLVEGNVSLRDSFHRTIMERDKVSQHRTGLVKRAVPVVLAHTILLQEVVLQHAGDLQGDLVVFAQRALPDELDNLCEIVLLLRISFVRVLSSTKPGSVAS
jgi:hypothetical protein